MTVNIGNKRSTMILYSGADDIYSHQVRIVLEEKGITYESIYVDPLIGNKTLSEINPYNNTPTLVDRDLIIYDAHVILEYLDERFPHPPLMPIYPVLRANSRLIMNKIKLEWYSLAQRIVTNTKADKARKELKEELLDSSSILEQNPYFLSEEFGLIDSYMAALLWRLPVYEIELEGAQGQKVMQYANRLFQRKPFQSSMTEKEMEMSLIYE